MAVAWWVADKFTVGAMEPAIDRPVIERNVVRAVVLDSADRMLLLQVGELGNPEFGTAWELPGGGIEAGETHAEAVIRELREETGIVVTTEQIAAPTWRRDVLYDYRGMRRLQHEAISLVRLAEPAPAIQDVLRDGFEQQDLFEARWWTQDEILSSAEWFYPRSLPSMLGRFLDGAVIEEGLEVWDKDAWRAASS
jgi:8-oxo-dGTP pyrophosphatase MutT (NUDIX family)